MRFLLWVILIAVLSYAAEYFMPWWSMAIVAFLITFLARLRPGKSFLLGVAGIGLCWLVVMLIRDIPNQHILSQRMAAVFPFKGIYPLFILVTVFVGALVGGLSAMTGSLLAPRK